MNSAPNPKPTMAMRIGVDIFDLLSSGFVPGQHMLRIDGEVEGLSDTNRFGRANRCANARAAGLEQNRRHRTEMLDDDRPRNACGGWRESNMLRPHAHGCASRPTQGCSVLARQQ